MAPPGWYPDPHGITWQRYWDGSTWTDRTRDIVNPSPPAPGPARYRMTAGAKVVVAGVLVVLGLAMGRAVIDAVRANRDPYDVNPDTGSGFAWARRTDSGTMCSATASIASCYGGSDGDRISFKAGGNRDEAGLLFPFIPGVGMVVRYDEARWDCSPDGVQEYLCRAK